MFSKHEYVLPAVLGVCTAGFGALIGYKLASKKRKVAFKSFNTNDPLIQYATQHSVNLNPIQETLKQVTLQQPMGIMMGSLDEVSLLVSICRATGVTKAIEVGVFTGMTTLAIAQVLPEHGKIVACDISEEYANIGKPFWAEAGVDKKIDLQIGHAADTLRRLIANGEAGTYDFAFVDADKTGYDEYYELCLTLMRKGGLIVLDNMLQAGKVIDPAINTPAVCAIRALNDKIHADRRVHSTLVLIGDGTVFAFKL